MFTTILVALKFSPGGLRALAVAADLARSLGAKLWVFHALESTLAEGAEGLEQARAEAQDRYELLAQPSLAGLGECHFRCHPAEPGAGACALAREIGADLLVCGSHQRQGLGQPRLGYTGLTLVETAPCAVMLTPFLSDSAHEPCHHADATPGLVPPT